jgi:PAS domain S-box-containing protein
MPNDTFDDEWLMRAAVEQAVDAIAIVTADDFMKSKIVYVNEACCKLLGCRAEDLLGRSRLALAGTRAAPDALDLARAAAAVPEQPFFAHVTRVRADGAPYDVEGHIAPLRNEQGQVTRYVVTERDVTRRNREERQLRAEMLISERMRATAYLAAGAAYGLRDPLSRTLGSLELAVAALGRQGLVDESNVSWQTLREVSAAVSDAATACKCLHGMVSDLAVLAHDGGPTEPVDVDTALEHALDLTAFELARRAHIEWKRHPLPRVSANLSRLTQAFVNVLRNAAQAIPCEQPAHNWVRIRTEVDGRGRVVVEIGDSGEGIEPDDLPQVFEPFFTTRPAPVAVGLGLSVARATLVALGGEITIASEIGRGTRVRICLPACEAVEAERLPARQEPIRRQLILVVDDDPATYPAFARLLSSERAVLSFATKAEALERLALGEAIDLVVFDPATPWKSGLSFRGELEKIPPFASPVLELSPCVAIHAPHPAITLASEHKHVAGRVNGTDRAIVGPGA